MATVDWDSLPLLPLPIARLVWPCHDIDPGHLCLSEDDHMASQGPIRAEELIDGSYFVHDGRHRVIRAKSAGNEHIWAHVL